MSTSHQALLTHLHHFLSETPSPYHVSAYIKRTLSPAASASFESTTPMSLNPEAFTSLEFSEDWKLKPGGRYLIQRGGSTVAFMLPHSAKTLKTAPFRIWAAHSDSPALKLKSLDILSKEGQQILLCEPYGGVLKESWFNRDLQLAGRVFMHEQTIGSNNKRTPSPTALKESLFEDKETRYTIPAPAIHFKGAKPASTEINAETEFRVLMGIDSLTSPPPDPQTLEAFLIHKILSKANLAHLPASKQKSQAKNPTKYQAQKKGPTQKGGSSPKISGWDLAFVSAESPQYIGTNNDYLASSHLDNLAMTHAGLSAFADLASHSMSSLNSRNSKNSLQKPSPKRSSKNSTAAQSLARGAEETIPMFAVFNHEEIGSRSSEGAAGDFFMQILERIAESLSLTRGTLLQNLDRSFVLSADMAHATHPNYPHLHSEISRPLMGGGPVLKKNGHLRYISEGAGEAYVRTLATQAGIPLQTYTGRSDLPTGSTIGPLLASGLSIPTVDIGSPMLSMHSIRELMAGSDHLAATQLAAAFWANGS